MATSFPTSIDNFTNPTATSLLTSPSHSGQHADINDAVEAIETAIGTTAAPVLARLASPTFTGTPAAPTAVSGTNTTQIATTAFVTTANQQLNNYTAYTPTFNGLSIGNGTVTSAYCRVNKFVHYWGRLVFGTTTSVSGVTYFTLPVDCDATQSLDTTSFGNMYFYDLSASVVYPADGVSGASNASRAYMSALVTSGAYSTKINIGATVPFTWATGDIITWNFYYEAA